MSTASESPRRAYGGPVFQEGPWPHKLPLTGTRKRGRPRKDDKAAKITSLKEQNLSWGAIRKILNSENGERLTVDAYRNLYRSRKNGTIKIRRNSLYPVFLRLIEELQPRTLILPKRRGRTRKDQIRLEGRQIHCAGNSWRQVAIRLNAKHNQKLSAEAYRKLCSSAKRGVPWRKLDLNFILGLKFS